MIHIPHMFVPTRILRTFTDSQFNFYLNEMTPRSLVYITQDSEAVKNYLINEGYGPTENESVTQDGEYIETKLGIIKYNEKVECSFMYYNLDLKKEVSLTIMVYFLNNPNLEKEMGVENETKRVSPQELDKAVKTLIQSDTDYFNKRAAALAESLNITEACAADVIYLRTRNRWTPELEKELIRLHKEGNPPNVMDFGCTPETGQALMNIAEEEYKKKKGFKEV